MKRFELGMSLDYVSHWTVVDALRELFQNCLDAYKANPENMWYVDYNEEENTIRIGNKKGVLNTNTLLLGKTTKRDKADQIGKFGEGYKVATVVLLRCGCTVTVYNYEKKEIWRSKLINSRRYGDVVPVFDIQSDSLFSPIKGNDLIFEVTGITSEMWESVVEKNLFLQNNIGEVVESQNLGRVLLDEKFAGCIYVSGLFVCKKEHIHYGYDLSPSMVELDRDRGLVDSYNLQFSLGRVLACTGDADLIHESVKYFDGKYVSIYSFYSESAREVVSDRFATEFIKNHGTDAVPCTSNDEFNYLVKLGKKAVMVSDSEKDYIVSSTIYSSSSSSGDARASVSDRLISWMEVYAKSRMPEEAYKVGISLVNELITEVEKKEDKTSGNTFIE